MAQGHAHARRSVRRRARDRPQPVPRLPADRDLHARVRRAPATTCRATSRRTATPPTTSADERHPVARASLARQAGPLELARQLRARQGRGHRRRSCRRRPVGRARRRPRPAPSTSPRPTRPAGLPRAWAAWIRRRALPAVRRHRRVLPQGRRRRARDAARVRRTSTARSPGSRQVPLHAYATARRGLDAGRSDVEGRQGQGPDRRAQLPRRQRACNSFSFLTYNARWRRRQRLAVRRARTTSSTTTARSSTSGASSSTTRTARRPLPPLQAPGDRDRRQPERASEARRPTPCRSRSMAATLGPERKLYCRELIARFGHDLALNWNLGEENTQYARSSIATWRGYLHDTDPYRAPHRHPHLTRTSRSKVYPPLLGDQSVLTGASLQNAWNVAHQRTLQWVTRVAPRRAGRGSWPTTSRATRGLGVPPDPGYQGFDGQATRAGPQSYDDPRHPEADALGQPHGRRCRRRVLLRLPAPAERPGLRRLAQPRPELGLLPHRARLLPRRRHPVLGDDQSADALVGNPTQRQQQVLPCQGRRGLPRSTPRRAARRRSTSATRPGNSR